LNKKFLILSTSSLILSFSLNGCNVSLSEVVETAQNPEPAKIASVVEKTVKSMENNRQTPRNSTNIGGDFLGFGSGTSLFSKVKDKLNDTPFYTDNFDSYGIGQLPPYGEWTGNAPIKTLVSPDRKITNVVILRNDRYICLRPKFKDFYLTFNANIVEWGNFRIKFRKQKHPNVNYSVERNNMNDFFILYKTADGKDFELARNKLKLSKGSWHTIELYVNKDKIILYADYSVVFDIKDNDKFMQKEGEICLKGYSGDPIYIDNFKIYKIK